MLVLALPFAGPAGSAPAPARKPKAAPSRPAPDAEGWEALPMQGVRSLELSLEGRSRIAVRVLREATARFRARRLDPAGVASTLAPMEVERESGAIFLSRPEQGDGDGSVAAGEASPELVQVELEVPSRSRLMIFAGEADITLQGEKLPIEEELEPYQPPPPPDPRGTRATPPSGAAPAPAGAAEPRPRQGAATSAGGGAGGGIEVQVDAGSLAASDLLSDIRIETKAGTVSLARLAGSTKVIGGGSQVTAAGLEGPLFLEGASSFVASGLRGAVEVKGATGRVEVRGVAKDARMTVNEGDVYLEDIRGRLELRLVGGSARLSELRAACTLNLDSTDVSVERITMGLQANGAGSSLRVRECAGPIGVSGSRDVVEVEASVGPVTIQVNEGDIRLRDVRTDVSVRGQGANVSAVGIGGRININSEGGHVVLVGVTRPVSVTADSIEAEVTSPPGYVFEQAYRAQSYVRVTLPDGRWDIKVKAGGEVRSDLAYERLLATPMPPEPSGEAKPDAPAGQASPGQASARPASAPAPRGGSKLDIICEGDVEILKE
jgi:hypothetical protein